MLTVVVPEELIAERARLGLDTQDEVWEGVYHVAPQPIEPHEHVVNVLAGSLHPLVRRLGLRAACNTSVHDPGEPELRDFRVPDYTVYDDQTRSRRGVEGAARLVVEVRSPSDETFEKFPFYERVGVLELVVIDRDALAVRRWARVETALVEVGADADGWHRLDALPAALRAIGGRLEIDADGEVEVVEAE